MAFPTSRILLKTKTPGLIAYENFLPQKNYGALITEAFSLRDKIDRARSSALSYRSLNHNIPGERHYKAVVIQDEFRTLKCEDFHDYGDRNHTLTYFRDNHNVPLFISTNLISPICKLPAITRLSAQGLLNWRFTFNTYASHPDDENTLAGFQFHKDIAVNGTITMIYSMGASTIFQIRDPQNHEDSEIIDLPSNSLLLLTGKSRWDYEHSVIPKKITGSSLGLLTAIRRISLVLGCMPIMV